MWEWHDDMFDFEAADLNVPGSLWNDLGQHEVDLSFLFDDITQVKTCGDLDHQNTNNGEMSISKKETTDDTKDMEKSKSSSAQAKRRRMLQFESEPVPFPSCNEVTPPMFPNEKDREDTLVEAFSSVTQWVNEGFPEDTSSSGYEGRDQLSKGFLANRFTKADIQFNIGCVNKTGASEVQKKAGLFKIPPEPEASPVKKCLPQSRKNVVFKGKKKSCMQAPAKTTSSVVYPFSFIKPCGINGDLTLRDINERIRNPPKRKEDPDAMYPTSAFSGKPVVNQMKIRTGGKGCITIMRTKG